jgi:hypothetical protein
MNSNPALRHRYGLSCATLESRKVSPHRHSLPSQTHFDGHSHGTFDIRKFNYKQTPAPLVRKRTIPTELPPLVDEV